MPDYKKKMEKTEDLLKDYCKKASRPDDEVQSIIRHFQTKFPDDDDLLEAGYSDLKDAIPKDVAREILDIWREHERHDRNRDKINVVVDTSPEAEAARLSVDKLIDKYNPDLQPDAYGKRLGEIARAYTKNTLSAPKVLIFDDKGKFDAQLTKDEFDRLKGVGADRDIAIHKGNSYETFPVGNRPPEFAEQSPWNPAETLYNGVSNGDVHWGQLSRKARQLIYIVTFKTPAYDYRLHDKDLKTLATYREAELFDELHTAADDFQAAVKIFPYAGAFFKDLERQGELPSMKVPVGGAATPAPAGGGTGGG